jgi:hypothetical protein
LAGGRGGGNTKPPVAAVTLAVSGFAFWGDPMSPTRQSYVGSVEWDLSRGVDSLPVATAERYSGRWGAKAC